MQPLVGFHVASVHSIVEWSANVWSVPKPIVYVQSLWDRMAATPEQVPVPEWHREILDDRLKDNDTNPDAGESWDVVRERLRDKLRQR